MDVRVICQKWLLWHFSEIWHHVQLHLISLSFRFNIAAYMSSHDCQFYVTSKKQSYPVAGLGGL
jgi:hypothetical protein